VWRLARQRVGPSDVNGTPDGADPRDSIFRHHHELARYAGIGVISTVAYLVLFLLLRDAVGMFAANLIAAAATAAANTVGHTLFTYRAVRGGQIRQALEVGAFSFALGIGLTTAALAGTYATGRTSETAEGLAIVFGLLAASVVRFVLLREWAFRNHTRREVRGRYDSDASDQDDGAPLQAA
jgi:putative flippase GtrA